MTSKVIFGRSVACFTRW